MPENSRVRDMFSPPPPHAAGFHSDHLDEIRAYVATYDGTHLRTALRPGPVGYSAHAVRCGAVDLAWVVTRTPQKVRGVPQSPILHLPLGRRHVYAIGGRTLEARPDTAVLLAPGQEYTLYSEPDDCVVVLRMPGSALANELADRDPAAAPASLGMREIPLAGRRLGALAAMHRMLVDATGPKTENACRPRAEQLEARLRSWLANQILGTRASSSAPALGIHRIRMVEEWIDAHLADPITLGRLCAVAGVGDRCLQSAFRAYRGQTPLQFVMARRLAWVRRSLLDSKRGQSVTQLAHDAGFVHLGRFAVRYRSTYDESPSATLQHSLSRF